MGGAETAKRDLKGDRILKGSGSKEDMISY